MKWTDAEDIGIALAEKFPGVDPLTVRFTDLRERVLALDGFDDDPEERRTSRSSKRFRWRGTRSSRTRNERSAGCSGPGMRGYFIPLVAGVVLAVQRVSAVGDRRRRVAAPAFPTSPALWIVGLGALAASSRRSA